MKYYLWLVLLINASGNPSSSPLFILISIILQGSIIIIVRPTLNIIPFIRLLLLFPAGDKEKGLQELRNAAENSIFLKAESYSILSWICIYYEDNFNAALYYSHTLFGNYPSNKAFRGEYIKNLILLKDYDEAEKIIKTSEVTDNIYFTGQIAIFNGLIQEKKYHDYSKAENYYTEGIKYMKRLGARGDDYQQYGEEALKRIGDQKEGKIPGKRKRDRNSHDGDDLIFDN